MHRTNNFLEQILQKSEKNQKKISSPIISIVVSFEIMPMEYQKQHVFISIRVQHN